MKSQNLILMAVSLLLAQCGMGHLKRTDISERTDVSVSSSPDNSESFGTTVSSGTREPASGPTPHVSPPVTSDDTASSRPKPFGPVDIADPVAEIIEQDTNEFAEDETQINPVPDDTAGDLIPESADTENQLENPESNPAQQEALPDVAYPEVEPYADSGFDWQRVLITEVVTDPQQDHNGSGNTSASDEYVEIFNGTSVALDVSGWRLDMLDGSDESMMLDGSSGEFYFSEGGDFSQFQSGEVMVVGNPAGTINNSTQLDLLDEFGVVVDSVVIEDANATGLIDEAYFLDEEGDWQQGFATPGELMP